MQADAIVSALEQQERESTSYWNAFDEETFFAKIGSGWSPAETVRHLTKATGAVADALRYPKLMLRVLFGSPKRPPMSLDELVPLYRKKLDEGGRAGRFGPSDRDERDRAAIMNRFARAQNELRVNMRRWSETNLDRFQLPHPILGKLTVREMLLFTLYHQRHHIDVIKGKLA